MRQIPDEFRRCGMTFRLVKRTGALCMYRNDDTHFEVMRIGVYKRPPFIGGKQIAEAGDEYLPGDSQWGSRGWTLHSREAAEAKWVSLLSEETVK